MILANCLVECQHSKCHPEKLGRTSWHTGWVHPAISGRLGAFQRNDRRRRKSIAGADAFLLLDHCWNQLKCWYLSCMQHGSILDLLKSLKSWNECSKLFWHLLECLLQCCCCNKQFAKIVPWNGLESSKWLSFARFTFRQGESSKFAKIMDDFSKSSIC